MLVCSESMGVRKESASILGILEISPNDIWKVILLSFIKPFKRISDYLFQFQVGMHLYILKVGT